MIIHKSYENGTSLKIVIPHQYAAALKLKAQSHVVFELLPEGVITLKALALSQSNLAKSSKKKEEA